MGGGTFTDSIVDIVNKYNGSITCYDMSKYNLPLLPVNLPGQRANIPVESYFRLFVPNVLSSEIDKVLWLDCDIIVADTINALWDEDISDYGVGAIPDFEHNNVHIMNRLGYDATYGYFNAGVLLINVKYWRENNVIADFQDYIHNHFNELKFHDQDVLNYVFYHSKKELSIRYNFQMTFLYKNNFRNFSCKYFTQVDEYYQSPSIIHYTDSKPWFDDTISPMKAIFIKYQDMTRWKGVILKKKKTLKRQIINIAICIKYKEKTLRRVYYDSKYL